MNGTTVRNGRPMIAGTAALAILATGVVVTVLGGGSVELLYALGGGVGASVVVGGVYALGRRFGQPHSHAVAEAAIALGVLALLAIVFRLLTEFGA